MSCLLNGSTNFRDSLHSLNGNCISTSPEKFHHPVTSVIYITIAVLCILLSITSHVRYNSIRVLNLTFRSNVISNTPWIVYFLVLFVRSVMGSVIYAITPAFDKQHGHRLTVYFLLDGAFKSLEVLCLCWALNHQWMYRSGFSQQEIKGLNSGEYSASGSEHELVTSAAVQQVRNSKAGAVFVAQFILAILFMILMEELTAINREEYKVLFWIYICLFWSQCISTIVFAVLIAATKNEDGPTVMAKVLFAVGVILTLPGDIPSFIWSCYIKSQCITIKAPWFLTGYDFALFFSIPSAITFFVALRMEFLRLDQEAQHDALGSEVDSLFSVHSRTTTES